MDHTRSKCSLATRGHFRSSGSGTLLATVGAPSNPGNAPQCCTASRIRLTYAGNPPLVSNTTNWGYLSQGDTHLNANTPWFNLTLGLGMLIGRFLTIVPALAIAGSLARKRRMSATIGTMPTDGVLFVILLLGTIFLVTALTFFPAFCLGPIAEAYQMK